MEESVDKTLLSIHRTGDVSSMSLDMTTVDDCRAICVALYTLFNNNPAISVLYPLVAAALDHNEELKKEIIHKVDLGEKDFNDILKNLPKTK